MIADPTREVVMTRKDADQDIHVSVYTYEDGTVNVVARDNRTDQLVGFSMEAFNAMVKAVAQHQS